MRAAHESAGRVSYDDVFAYTSLTQARENERLMDPAGKAAGAMKVIATGQKVPRARRRSSWRVL